VDDISLIVSLDENNKASGVLYHDAVDGYDYKNGEYALISFKAEKKGNTIEIKKSIIEGNMNIEFKNVNISVVFDDEIVNGDYKFSREAIKIKL